MEQQKKDQRFLLGLSIATLCLGVVTLGSFVWEAPSLESAVAASEGPRTPASLFSTEPGSTKESALALVEKSEKLVDWNLFCRNTRPREVHVQGRSFRFRGKHCGARFQPEKLIIVNEDNGSNAVIFLRRPGEFETDLIPLNEGANRIRIRYGSSAPEAEDHVLTVMSSI